MGFIKKYAWAAWMGGAFSAAGWDAWDWQFYVAIIPIVFLVEWKCTK